MLESVSICSLISLPGSQLQVAQGGSQRTRAGEERQIRCPWGGLPLTEDVNTLGTNIDLLLARNAYVWKLQMEANYTSFFLLLLETQPLVLAEEGNAVSSLAKLFFFPSQYREVNRLYLKWKTKIGSWLKIIELVQSLLDVFTHSFNTLINNNNNNYNNNNIIIPIDIAQMYTTKLWKMIFFKFFLKLIVY